MLKFLIILLFFYFIFWLCWVFIAAQAFSRLRKKSCSGFSLRWLLLWWNTGFRACGGGLVAKSCLTLVTPWTVALQAPLSMGFPGKNTGVGCHFLLQGNLSNPGTEPGSLALQAGSLPTEPPGKPSFSWHVGLCCSMVRGIFSDQGSNPDLIKLWFVSCIGRHILFHWATREAPNILIKFKKIKKELSAFQDPCSVLQAPLWIQTQRLPPLLKKNITLMTDDGEGRGLLIVFGESQISQSLPQSCEERYPAQPASVVFLWWPVAVPPHLPSSTPSKCSYVMCVPSHFSRVQLSATLWTVAHQASLSMGFSR